MTINSIVRIDYQNYSCALNYDDIGYMSFHIDTSENVAIFTIYLTVGQQIDIMEGEEKNHAVLRQLYLDYYVRWKNYTAEQMEISQQQQYLIEG